MLNRPFNSGKGVPHLKHPSFLTAPRFKEHKKFSAHSTVNEYIVSRLVVLTVLKQK